MSYKNPEDKKIYDRKYNQSHKKEVDEYARNYYQSHKAQRKISNRDYYQSHKDEHKEYSRIYRQLHKNESNIYQREYYKEHQTVDKRINHCMRATIGDALKGNKAGRKWESLVGYTLKDLMKHLESKFESWMTWGNYGKWHIDHIKPKSLFKYKTTKDSEFRKCWALENLQPLEAGENHRKGNRYYLI